MTIRGVTCPSCNATVNVSATMANARCPSCGTIWNVNNPAATKLATQAAVTRKAAGNSSLKEESVRSPSVNIVLIAGLVGGGALLVTLVGVAAVIMNRNAIPATASQEMTKEVTKAEDTIKPVTPEEYRVINLPEETRKRMYNDYRKVARSTVETPLMVPQETNLRQATEGMLQGVFDRELMRFAALYDVTVNDVKEVIKEGDAKGWDGSPRSNAVRDGKRVYSEDMSEGWEKNPN